MTGILELLRINPPSAETARATVAQLEEKTAAASAWLEQCQAELDAALLAAAEGLADAAQVSRARKTAEQARQAANDAEAALRGARQRVADAEAVTRDAATAERWKKIAELCKRRQDYAALIETQIAGLGEQVRMLLQLSAEIYEIDPGEVDIAASALSQSDLRNAIREQLWRHEVVSGSPWSTWELLRRPSLIERIEAGNEALHAMGEIAK